MEAIESLKDALARVRAEIAKVIIGQEAVIDHALMAILSRQHLLVEGVPGVGKTLMVRTLAKVLGVPNGRIQFTPDLMPADITGTKVFNLRDQGFQLVPGPVFTTFLLADEINRAPAKTQSALLQAMQERRVTIDNETHHLAGDFTVFATQNPVEYEGTYPLPEAQKDRFLLKTIMSYPSREEEVSLALRMLDGTSPENVLDGPDGPVPVLDPAGMAMARQALSRVTLRPELIAYIVDMIRSTRGHEAVLVGAGPRATQAMLACSRVRAVLEGRDFVSPDDIRALAEPVLGHRLVLRPEYEIEGVTIGETVERIVAAVPVPR
jgi:MoxR-like ATPase